MRSGVGVDADARADAAGAPAAVAEVHGHGVVGWPGTTQAGAERRRARQAQLDDVVRAAAVCSVRTRPSCRAVFGLRSAALSQVSLVSGLGQLLQPAVVGEAAVVRS